MLHLFVDEVDSEDMRAALGLLGNTVEKRVEHELEASVSYEERRAVLKELDSVPVGSTAYSFAAELPDALGERPVVVRDETIEAVTDLARAADIHAETNAYPTPQPHAVLSFLRDHRGERVFLSSVRFEDQ